MKKTLTYTLCLLVSVLLIATLPTEADAAIYEDTVRLHILAESDSASDQALKLFIRDRLLEKYSAELSLSGSADEAFSALEKRIDEIESDCNVWIYEFGGDVCASVSVEREWYNTREYGELTLPAGEYASLKIVLGNGKGQNWWCVMYPPLCLDAALSESDDAYTKTEKQLVTKGGYRVKFKLLEVTSAIFESFSQ